MAALVKSLEKALRDGKNVTVHCRQGIGRSSLAAASVLVSAGERPYDAWRKIENSRGCPVPDTPEQEQWVVKFASAFSVNSPGCQGFGGSGFHCLLLCSIAYSF
jgi:hypothetical protein